LLNAAASRPAVAAAARSSGSSPSVNDGVARKGVPKPASGALVVDGQPFSPQLPAHLRDIAPPKLGATRADIAAAKAQAAAVAGHDAASEADPPPQE
jgi:hypothetical protein